jgi:hyaluronan synthase
VSTTGQDSHAPLVGPATAAHWRRREQACSEVLPPPADDGEHANGADPPADAAIRPDDNGERVNGFHPPGDAAIRPDHNGERVNGFHPPGDVVAIGPGDEGKRANGSKASGESAAITSLETVERRFVESQQAGLAAMIGFAKPEAPLAGEPEAKPSAPVKVNGHPSVIDTAPLPFIIKPAEEGSNESRFHRAGDDLRGVSGDHGSAGADSAVLLAARQGPRGALSASYDIPRVQWRRRGVIAWVSLAVIAVAVGLGRHVLIAAQNQDQRSVQALWAAGFAWMGFQWLLSWLDRPRTVSVRQQRSLDAVAVTVIVPLYNEAPEVVDRVLYAIAHQSRPPQRVIVVDDGSTVDYAAVRDHWQVNGPPLNWMRQPNAGKKHAQVTAFRADHDADVFVTIDSDTMLERQALMEGLKPFADPRVMSVAGFEVAANPSTNWLTRTSSARSLAFQITACGVQSAFGEILVNRGAFALYRAQLLRDVAYAYTHETFRGVPIRLGDDAALTLFARGRGRTVQQPSAFSFTVYPETLSHHFRQWIRWMRATLIRDCWRLRYLPLSSYGFWFTIINTITFLAMTATPILIAACWPRSEHFAAAGILAMSGWSAITSLRLLAVRRSDQTLAQHIGTLFYYPAALLWSAYVLRPLRFYGILTWKRQGWATRKQVEVTMGGQS